MLLRCWPPPFVSSQSWRTQNRTFPLREEPRLKESFLVLSSQNPLVPSEHLAAEECKVQSFKLLKVSCDAFTVSLWFTEG